MDTIGLDLHTRESQLCIMAEDGPISERRIVTSRERLTAVLSNYSPVRILLEASTESEWVEQHLESLGHEVIVADPNYAPMYASRPRRVKTDKRDARALAEPRASIGLQRFSEYGPFGIEAHSYTSVLRARGHIGRCT